MAQKKFRLDISQCFDDVLQLPKHQRLKLVNKIEDLDKKAFQEAGEKGIKSGIDARQRLRDFKKREQEMMDVKLSRLI